MIIVSDFHMCAKSHSWESELESLRGLWADAKTVIFNGDTISWSVARHPDKLEKLKLDITDYFHKQNLEVIFIAGNSEQEISDRDYQFLCDEKILVLHGHAIFEDVSPWSYHVERLAQIRRDFIESIPHASRNTLDVACKAARTAMIELQREHVNKRCKTKLGSYVFIKLHNIRTLLRFRKIMHIWRQAPQFAANFLDQYAPQAKFLIMGHTHRSGTWKVGERVIINTGCIKKPSTALYVRVENNTLKVFRVRRNKKQLIPGPLVEEFSI